MKIKNRSKTAGSLVVPLRVRVEMRKDIRRISDKAQLCDSDIMRLAIERGLGQVEAMFERSDKQAA